MKKYLFAFVCSWVSMIGLLYSQQNITVRRGNVQLSFSIDNQGMPNMPCSIPSRLLSFPELSR